MMLSEDERSFAIEVAEGFAKIAMAYRNETRSEVPMGVHLIRFRSGEPEVIALNSEQLNACENKEAMSMAIRAMVSLLGAKYVILINEAWASVNHNTEEYQALMEWTEAGNSLKDFPGRQEILMVSLDGPDVSLMLSADITSDGGADNLQRVESVMTEGRLANLSHSVADNDPKMWN